MKIGTLMCAALFVLIPSIFISCRMFLSVLNSHTIVLRGVQIRHNKRQKLHHPRAPSNNISITILGAEKPIQQESIQHEKRLIMRQDFFQKSCDKWREPILLTYKNYQQQILSSFEELITRKREEFLLWREKNVAFCSASKIGSAKLFTALNLVDRSEISNASLLEKKYLAVMRPMEEELKDWDILNLKGTFIIAVHPFRRILAAYRDKFRYRRDKKQFQKYNKAYGKKIIKKYRKRKQRDTTYEDSPTFREFVEFLADIQSWKSEIIWKPIYMQCLPCFIHYTLILHMEHLKEDLLHMGVASGIRDLEFTNLAEVDDVYMNEIFFGQKYLAEEIEKFYYSTLTKELLGRLYKVYKIDFDLFNYSLYPFDKYVHMR